MKSYVTIDGGTTNTRLYLVSDLKVERSVKLAVGARNGKDALLSAISGAIGDLVSNTSELEAIIASGMISSEYGLVNLPHVIAPAGKDELSEAMYKTEFEVTGRTPWYFIRGVKTVGDTLKETDVMRGEETELMGLTDEGEDAIYVMPGSHSKHVKIDRFGRIISFSTMLSGELFTAILENTILRDAADLSCSNIVAQKLKEGYGYASQHGINEALFKARILKNLFAAGKDECYSFLLGATLSAEVESLISNDCKKIIITGQKQQKDALSILLSDSGKEVKVIDDLTASHATALGAVKIFECR